EFRASVRAARCGSRPEAATRNRRRPSCSRHCRQNCQGEGIQRVHENGRVYELNFQQDSIFPKWQEFQAYLKSKGETCNFVPLKVGGSVAADGQGNLRFDGISSPFSDDEIRDMIKFYRDV